MPREAAPRPRCAARPPGNRATPSVGLVDYFPCHWRPGGLHLNARAGVIVSDRPAHADTPPKEVPVSRDRRTAFTLIELLVVIAIIAILIRLPATCANDRRDA